MRIGKLFFLGCHLPLSIFVWLSMVGTNLWRLFWLYIIGGCSLQILCLLQSLKTFFSDFSILSYMFLKYSVTRRHQMKRSHLKASGKRSRAHRPAQTGVRLVLRASRSGRQRITACKAVCKDKRAMTRLVQYPGRQDWFTPGLDQNLTHSVYSYIPVLFCFWHSFGFQTQFSWFLPVFRWGVLLMLSILSLLWAAVGSCTAASWGAPAPKVRGVAAPVGKHGMVGRCRNGRRI